MKILYIGGDSKMCGAGLSMVKLIEEEINVGVEVVPVVKNGFTQKILENKNIKHYVVNVQSWVISKKYNWFRAKFIYYIKKIINIKCYFQYIKIIKKEKPDIVHINALTTHVGAKAAIKLKKRVVWHIRELIEEDLNGKFANYKYAHKLMKKANVFIAISNCVEEKFAKIVGKDKIVRIYNGVDIEKYYCEHHNIFSDNNITITMAGRITKEKGQALCLIALASLLNKNRNIVLQFAGTGSKEELQILNSIIKDEKINKDQIRFLGYVENMKEVWANTDIAIIYSKFEAFGRVTVEAKMAGCIVVGYNSGGTIELISNGIDGYLFDTKEALAKIISKVINNQEKSKHIAKTGQQQACKNYTSTINCDKVIELFDLVIRGKYDDKKTNK